MADTSQFKITILGLDINLAHLQIDISVQDLKEIPNYLKGIIRDKVIDFLSHKLLGGIEEGGKKVLGGIETGGKEVLGDMKKGGKEVKKVRIIPRDP